MLGYTRLGLKKVEASKGQLMVLPEGWRRGARTEYL